MKFMAREIHLFIGVSRVFVNIIIFCGTYCH